MRIGNRDFQTSGHTYVMGILNVTPDSFSDGGRWNHMDDALFHAQRMIEEGADILDIGGESTRPGYTRISDEEEISRVAPVIEALKKRFDTPLSVDTYKSGVASAAIAAAHSCSLLPCAPPHEKPPCLPFPPPLPLPSNNTKAFHTESQSFLWNLPV